MIFPVWLLSFVVGFLSLSVEILWVRFFGFAHHSLPQAFSFVLAFYLVGIALGALIGKRFCTLSRSALWTVSGVVLIFSSLCDIACPSVYANYVGSHYNLYLASFLIALTAGLKAIVFPVAHHLGASSGNSTGKTVSRVYVANVAGATLGPILTGFVFLSYFSTQQCFVICAALTLLTAIFCLSTQVKKIYLAAGSIFAAIFFSFILHADQHSLIKYVATNAGSVKKIIENHYGIIVLYEGGNAGDLVYGGNVYDGRTNLDPVINSNRLERLIIMSALSGQPERVLVLGLSIGSWLKIITSFPGIKSIDVVEINPGYLQAIQEYPRQASALNDPRVHVYIDDGRRWLKSHPEEKYDLVVMNATYYWRMYSTNLLSKESLMLLKSHMKEKSILSYNSTSSLDVLKTAVTVFSHAYLYENFVIAADFDWRKKLQEEAAEKKLAALRLDGKFLFPSGQEALIKRFLKKKIITLDEVDVLAEAIANRKLEVITDQNLITEYKYGNRL